MLLVLDNGSVYTPNLLKFLGDISVNFKSITPNELASIQLDSFDSFILSGRRQNSSQTNSVNSMIIKHAISYGKSLLGICYGAEILALTLGGTIRRMSFSHTGEENVRITKDNPLCTGTISVFESHTFETARLGDKLINLGESDVCANELVQVHDHNIFGTQFHPEMSKDGQDIIKRFTLL